MDGLVFMRRVYLLRCRGSEHADAAKLSRGALGRSQRTLRREPCAGNRAPGVAGVAVRREPRAGGNCQEPPVS